MFPASKLVSYAVRHRHQNGIGMHLQIDKTKRKDCYNLSLFIDFVRHFVSKKDPSDNNKKRNVTTVSSCDVFNHSELSVEFMNEVE